MKKLILFGLALAIAVLPNSYVFAAAGTTTKTSQVTATVSNYFGVEFYPRDGYETDTEGKIHYDKGGPIFFEASAMKDIVYPQGRTTGDGISDVGILCLSNTGQSWELQMSMTSATLESDHLVVNISGSAYYRNEEGVIRPTTFGHMKGSDDWGTWKKIPKGTGLLVFSESDPTYVKTTPWGTLLTFNFGLSPSGRFNPTEDGVSYGDKCNGKPLTPGEHQAVITYTLVAK